MKKLLILSAMMMTLIACNRGNDNPLLSEQNTPYGVPAFDKIKLEHYRPAFDVAIEAATKEVNAITSCEEAPTFQNTIAALDRSGKQLQDLSLLFFELLETADVLLSGGLCSQVLAVAVEERGLLTQEAARLCPAVYPAEPCEAAAVFLMTVEPTGTTVTLNRTRHVTRQPASPFGLPADTLQAIREHNSFILKH